MHLFLFRLYIFFYLLPVVIYSCLRWSGILRRIFFWVLRFKVYVPTITLLILGYFISLAFWYVAIWTVGAGFVTSLLSLVSVILKLVFNTLILLYLNLCLTCWAFYVI